MNRIGLILIAHHHLLIEEKKEILPDRKSLAALATVNWGTRIGENNISNIVQEKLEPIIFADNRQKINFLRDTIEPFLEKNASHVSGLGYMEKIKNEPDVGQLALEWLKEYSVCTGDTLKQLLVITIFNGKQKDLIPTLREKITKQSWMNEEEKKYWICTAFWIDFDDSIGIITNCLKENKDYIWTLQSFIPKPFWPLLTEKQLYFIISEYRSIWPRVDMPSSWTGNHPWEACQFIISQISDLGSLKSDEATDSLRRLDEMTPLDGYSNYIKHTLEQQRKIKSESKQGVLSLSDIKKILQSGEPSSHSDLQEIVLYSLKELEDRTRNGPEDEYKTYWDNNDPQEENYCRNRLQFGIKPFLDKYNIACSKEAAMPNEKRCDLHMRYGVSMNLPIEVKGQWHKDLWKAAGDDQLGKYIKHYQSDGFGIYLVLWFGAHEKKKVTPLKNRVRATTKDELYKMLVDHYKDKISEKIKILVFDVSKPSN